MPEQPNDKRRRCNLLFCETDAVYHQIALRFGLSDSALRVLYALCDSDGSCRLRDICRLAGLSKQTLNSTVRKLEADGHVRLETAQARHKLLCLTETGEQLSQRTVRRLMEAEDAIMAKWPEAQVREYLHLTESFMISLREEAEKL